MLTIDTSFGHWLKRHRKSFDLTQEDLAQQVGCSSDLIRKIEAGTRRPSRLVAELIARSLEIPSEDHALFIRHARSDPRAQSRTERAPSAAPPQHNSVVESGAPAVHRYQDHLPTPYTTLIGREHALTEACTLLCQDYLRLLTLSGPGGVGKTQLALHVAADARASFADGTCFVGLAPVKDPKLVISTIAQALGVKAEGSRPIIETLQEHLRASRTLLILDNFEQVLDAAPSVAALLAACPRLKILATSRAALRIYGERELPVAPLALPPTAIGTLERVNVHTFNADMTHYAAIRLFVERARAVQPRFALNDENIGAVAEICARLDGLPLAIELAAARIKFFSPQALLAQLHRPLALLTNGPCDRPARQQTLRNSIAWSYTLLTRAEQVLFMRLSVFVGGCTLAAADAVGAGSWGLEVGSAPPAPNSQPPTPVLDGLASLIDKSLLQCEDGDNGEPRFMMLETIRAFALEQLIERGEAEEINRRHAAYYLTLAETAEPQLWGADRLSWLQRLELEHHNMRAALAWTQSTQGDPMIGLRLANALWWFWFMRSYINEARAWLNGALARGASTPAAARARVLARAGILAWFQSDFRQARAWCTDGLVLCREVGDALGAAYALHGLGLVALDHSEAEATVYFTEGLSICQELHDIWGSAWSLLRLGQSTWLFTPDEAACATALLNQSLKLFELMSDEMGMSHALIALGDIAMEQRDPMRARSLYEQSLRLSQHCGEKGTEIYALRGLGWVARYQAAYRQSAAWYHESLALCRELREQRGIVIGLEGLASVRSGQGQAEQAITLFAAAAALRDRLAYPLSPAWRADYQGMLDHAQARLDDATFATAWRTGLMLTPDQALTLTQDIRATS